MFDEPLDVLLQGLDSAIESLSADSIELILKRIDDFQQDPGKLASDGRLPQYVKRLVKDFFILDRQAQLQRCQVFYGLCKVAQWKKVVIHLPTNVFLLSELIAELQRGETDWRLPYLLLSWVYILALSPFRFDDLYVKIRAAIDNYRSMPSLKPVVAHIHSQLLSRTGQLIHKEFQDLDLLTINYLLKRLKLDDPIIDKRVLDHFNSVCFKEDDLTVLRILPRLFRINAYHEEWDVVEDIISFYLSHLNNRLTEYRFALAHSFCKVLTALIDDIEDNDTALQLVETCIDQVKVALQETSPAVVEHDALHTNLLIIAEMSNVISVSWPQLLEVIAEEIVPFASRFEQVRMKEIKGSQIKDASNYICWSLARSTRIPAVDMSAGVMKTIFLNLLMCSMFDRDLVVRRSANAALQEVLGRCFSSANILDNQTIVGLIELPVLNLVESFMENTHKMYQIFTKQQIYLPFAHYMLDWLIARCLVETNDLNTTKLAIQGISVLLAKAPSSISIVGSKLKELVASTSKSNGPHIASRILLLLVTLESGTLINRKSMNAIPIMEKYHEIILTSVKIEQKVHEGDDDEHFKFMVILQYWIFALNQGIGLKFDRKLVDVCFHIARMTPENSSKATTLFGDLIASLFRDPQNFCQPEDEEFFWTNFEKFIRFNNSLACSAVPLLPPRKFMPMVKKLLPAMDCQRKADFLKTLSDNLPHLVNTTGTAVLHTIVQLLNDYTVTQQGDVGRLVRIGAAKVIARHRGLFWNHELSSLTSDAVANLLRLSGEQVTDLRVICFSTLCEAFDHNVEMDSRYLNSQVLGFNRKFFGNDSIDFWKGFMITGGAINFTDSDIADAIDAFLSYYDRLPNNEERLALSNSLVRIIPSAKQISEVRNSQSRKVLGMMERDIVKETITYLNFWIRLLESGLVLDQDFNFSGFYAKIYNLNLIKANSLLRSTTVQLLPHLVSSQALATGNLDKGLANKIIRRLLSLTQREALSKRPELSGVQRDYIQALAHIYLESESFEHLELLKSGSLMNDKILNLSEAQLVL